MASQQRKEELAAKQFISPEEAEELLDGVRKAATIRLWIRKGILKGKQIVPNSPWLIRPQDLLALLGQEKAS